jgi:tetratricopeptide (TPR) repeat protein
MNPKTKKMSGSDSTPSVSEECFRQGEKASARKDWKGASEAFLEAIFRESDAPANWFFELGGSLMRLKDFRSAQLAYAQAIARDEDPPPLWYFDQGRACVRLRDWQGAADSFNNAISCHDEPPAPWLYRLGLVKERLKEWDAAAQWYAKALAADPKSTDVDRRLLEKEPHEFQGRRAVARFLEENMDEIRERAGAGMEGTDDKSDTIFSLWMQGVENAPPVVQACHRQLIRSTSRPIEYLDAEMLPTFAQLPDDIDAMEIGMAHRSDLLRIELLALYGGTWLDATCLVREDFDDRLEELMSATGFFAFAKRKATLSNWLLSVNKPGHYLILMLREALHTYLRHFGRMKRYYDFHYLFEGMVELDPGTRQIWEATPKIAHDRAHILQRRKFTPYDEKTFREYIDEAFVQKLSYKYPAKRAREDTMLGHMLHIY